VHIEEYQRLRELEDTYWWFVARQELALLLARRHAGEGPVLDMGCGTGAVLAGLQAVAPSVGLDVSPVALRFCKGRGLSRLVAGDAQALPFRSSSFSLIVALDVLEHLDDDKAALHEAARALQDGGVIVINVPAFKSLWGPHDTALHHRRRYRAGEVRRLLEEAGLNIETVSYGIFFLFPVVIFIRLVERARRGEARVRLPRVPKWLNRLLVRLQRFEAGLMRIVPLPWGSSVVAVARKPDQAWKARQGLR
jgi:SAM-dependent methyltransferase